MKLFRNSLRGTTTAVEVEIKVDPAAAETELRHRMSSLAQGYTNPFRPALFS